MVTSKNLFVPSNVPFILHTINKVAAESISIIYVDGHVEGYLKEYEGIEYVKNHSGKVEMWDAYEPMGIMFDEPESALIYMQGYFSCMFKNHTEQSIENFVNDIQNYLTSNSTIEERLELLFRYQLSPNR